jgi:GGDEF domain-containing protein
MLFRNSSDEFIAFLNDADAETAGHLAMRIKEKLLDQPLQLANGVSISINVSVAAACAPRDGVSVKDLVSIARGRGLVHSLNVSGPSVH